MRATRQPNPTQEQDVRILVPMVTLEEDIREMHVLFDSTLATFRGAKRPPFGTMIETPVDHS